MIKITYIYVSTNSSILQKINTDWHSKNIQNSLLDNTDYNNISIGNYRR